MILLFFSCDQEQVNDADINNNNNQAPESESVSDLKRDPSVVNGTENGVTAGIN